VDGSPLIIPKPGPDQYRMTVDLRVPNASTKPTAWPMSNLKDELHNLYGLDAFATRLLADTSTQRFSRLSIFNHAGCSIHTDACTTWNDKSYAISAVRARRHDGIH
jgi:hypothetical protein